MAGTSIMLQNIFSQLTVKVIGGTLEEMWSIKQKLLSKKRKGKRRIFNAVDFFASVNQSPRLIRN